MLDTINLNLTVNPVTKPELLSQEQGIELLLSQLEKIPNCDIMAYKPQEYKIRVRLSYPRAFDRTNAYLILTAEECQEVHHRFVNDILNFKNYKEEEILVTWFLNYVRISITQVDIPFTYYIGTDETFNDYQNIYKIVSEVFKFKNNKAIPKSIGSYLEDDIETLILADTENVGAYNKKVTIYNQAAKMQNYYSKKPKIYNGITAQYPDLDSRMRLEVSKRPRLKEKDLIEFSEFDIYGKYVVKFAKFALDNLFDQNILNEIYSQKINNLANLLQYSKQFPYFNYRIFILSNKNIIYDYKLLRQAIFNTMENENAKYSASSTVKGILKGLETDTGIIYMNTIEKINDITNLLQKIVRGER